MRTYISFSLLLFLVVSQGFAQNQKLIGTTLQGGGSIYSMDTDGNNISALKEFDVIKYPYRQLIYADGKLWGTTTTGQNGFGSIFYMLEGDMQPITVFDFEATDGTSPSSLTEINGQLWGIAGGGSENRGVIFRINFDGSGYEIVYDFPSTGGRSPVGALTHVNGQVWGMTYGGGTDDLGTIFKLQDDGTGFTQIMSFGGGSTGRYPGFDASLTYYNGRFYGMTSFDASSSNGTIFSIAENGTDFQTHYTFSSATGRYPNGSLTLVNGQFWGTTLSDDTFNGVVFSINPNGTGYTVRHQFSLTDGQSPYCDLVESNGYLWGYTQRGGENNNGVLFRIKTDGSDFSVVTHFNVTNGGNHSSGSLVEVNNRLYGLARTGGLARIGVIYSVGTDGQGHQVEYTYNNPDGFDPYGIPLLLDDYLYGTAILGGTSGGGVLYRIRSNGEDFQKLHEFAGTDGYSVIATPIFDGTRLWGATVQGGDNGVGVLYSLLPDGTDFQVHHHFDNSTGSYTRELLLADGKIWGVGQNGGTNSRGVLFSIDTDGTNYQVRHHFLNARSPGGGLVEVNGKLLGVSSSGGTNNAGMVFSYDLANSTMSELAHLNDATSNARSTLLPVGEYLYGVGGGGSNNNGSIFRLNADGTNPVLLHSFADDGLGRNPTGSLLQVGSQLVGTTSFGGNANAGVLYAIDADGSNYTVLHHFQPGVASLPAGQPTLITLKTEQNLTFEVTDKTYGDADFTLSAGSNTANPILYSSSDEAVISIEGDVATIVGAGTVTLTAYQEETETETAGAAEQTITVLKKTLTATADDFTITYGEAEPTYSITYSGFVPGEDAAVLDNPPSGASLSSTMTGAGTYTISIAEDATDNNYEFQYEPGQLTVEKATLTVTADDQSITYGDDLPTYTFSYSGFVLEENETVIDTPPSGVTATTTVSGAGEYTLAVTEDGLDDNYAFNYVDGTLTVGKATLEIIANNEEITYGDDLPTFTFSASGFVNEETADVLDTPPTVALDGELTNVGSYTLVASGGEDDNYTFTYINGQLSVAQAPLVVTAEDQTRTYGQANPTFTLAYQGFVLEENESNITPPEASTEATPTSDVGEYVITLTGGSATNYALTLQDGTLTIEQAIQTIDFAPVSTDLNEASPSFQLSATASSGMDVTFSSDDENIASVTGATVTITGFGEVTFTAHQAGDINYLEASVSQTVTIAQVLSALKQSGLTIYPNPAGTYFSLDGRSAGIREVRLVDVSGQVVRTYAHSAANSYAIASLPSGVYLVVLQSAEGTQAVGRLVKE